MKRRSLFGLLAGAFIASALPLAAEPKPVAKLKAKPRLRRLHLARRTIGECKVTYIYMSDITSREALRQEPPVIRVELLRVPLNALEVFDYDAQEARILANFGGMRSKELKEKLRYLAKWWELGQAYGSNGLQRCPEQALMPDRMAMLDCRSDGTARFISLDCLRIARQCGKPTMQAEWMKNELALYA